MRLFVAKLMNEQTQQLRSDLNQMHLAQVVFPGVLLDATTPNAPYPRPTSLSHSLGCDLPFIPNGYV